MTKKIISFVFSALVVVGLTTTFTGCKKGENDPFLSLKSRKARISGEWKLVSGSETSTYSSGGVSGSSSATYTETSYINNGTAYPYSETMTIDKDGTYKIEVTYDGDFYTITGNWFFAGAVKDLDLKNKEAVVFATGQYSEPGYSETYDGFLFGETYIIDQLKNKELVFKGEYSNSGNGYTSTDTYERIFEKK